MSEKRKAYSELVRRRLAEQGEPDLDAAVEEASQFLQAVGELDADLMDDVRDELIALVEERVRKIKDLYLLSRNRPTWYDENEQRGIHWPALASYLINDKGWQDTVVTESISPYSAKVVGELGDPSTTEFDVRGLVVGYVQSGKTANMTGVIARAVDAGYNLVVILAGMTDKLRHQTQKRLEKDLVRRNPYNWELLTRRNTYDTADGRQIDSGEYQERRTLPNVGRDVAMLAVVKKNRAILDRLIRDIGNTTGLPKNRLRMLVIDDEADQAGVNSAQSDETPAKTNRAIRKLLTALNTVSYVGYTATPYANILIRPGFAEVFEAPAEPSAEEAEEASYWSSLEDLYPRDFVIALPKPEGYFGAEQLFGRSPVDAEDEGVDGLDIIRPVSSEEVKALKDSAKGLDIEDVKSLRTAIRWFVLSSAARLVRGQSDDHQSMLLHTSHLTNDHSTLQDVVEPEIASITERISDPKIVKELEAIWLAETKKVSAETFGNEAISFQSVMEKVPCVLERLSIIVENSASEDRLSYDGKPSTVIAIGGNILSRGLTLEGLAVTYFTRNSKQYDTLLQMGRWFGYREGYEDLIRLWMPDSLRNSFRQLALVEHELREEIAEYAINDASPIDFAARIRTLPGLQVTGRNKMRHAVTARLDYQGLHLQTIRFPRIDEERLKENWKAGVRLADDAELSEEKLVGQANAEAIIRFCRGYCVDPSHRDLRSEWLEEYISQNELYLDDWSVGIFQPGKKIGPRAKAPLAGFKPYLINRSRLDSRNDAVADIKALMSLPDVLIDVPEDEHPEEAQWRKKWSWPKLKKFREKLVGPRPLLLLYPIDPNSLATTKERLDLKADYDVLGFGMVFPQLGIGVNKRPTRYIRVDFSSIQEAVPEEEGSEDGA